MDNLSITKFEENDFYFYKRPSAPRTVYAYAYTLFVRLQKYKNIFTSLNSLPNELVQF